MGDRNRGRSGRRGAAPWLAILALLGMSCQEAKPDLPAPPHTFEIALAEYEFRHEATVGAGRIVINMTNVGAENHGLTLLPLPEDAPPVLEILGSGKIFAPKADVAVPVHTSGSFAVDLTPGRYALICFVKGPDGIQHQRKNMASEFRVL